MNQDFRKKKVTIIENNNNKCKTLNLFSRKNNSKI
jgi:hypothetical protein